MKLSAFPCALFFLAVLSLGGAPEVQAAARDAAFMAPGGTSRGAGAAGGRSEEDVTVEPKSDVDAGETPLNVGRRATFFFVNKASAAIEIEEIKANGDSNVRADIVEDDCSREGKILASSRCSVTVETTPTGAGSWTAELLMTHKGAGRIARARVSGRTSGSQTEKAGTGLSLSTKDVKPIDFGEVEVGTGKAVRSALMVNDSNELIALLSIDVIAAENGLQRLEQGCQTDMELKMGESCPVTLVWQPDAKGALSTDLIIRHTGRLGFAVVPIRGLAKETEEGGAKGKTAGAKGGAASNGKEAGGAVPLPPTAEELEAMMSGKIPPLPADSLPSAHASFEASDLSGKEKRGGGSGSYYLIGTVGVRALLHKPNGDTVVVAVGESFEDEGGKTVKLIHLEPKRAEILEGDKKIVLSLQAAAPLTRRATEAKKTESVSRVQEKRETKKAAPSPSSTKLDEASGSAVSLPTGP